MTDTPDASPEKPKKKIIAVGEDRIKSDAGSERGGDQRGSGDRRGGKGRYEGDRKPATPPALMRGPKPKAKAVVEDVVEETVVEDAPAAVVNEAIANEATAESAPAAETVAEMAPEETSETAGETNGLEPDPSPA